MKRFLNRNVPLQVVQTITECTSFGSGIEGLTVMSLLILRFIRISNLFVLVQVKTFGLLVKGLRAGLDLLILLGKEEHLISSLSKVFTLPLLTGNDGLDKFLDQFEAAIDSEFPSYEVFPYRISLVPLLYLFLE